MEKDVILVQIDATNTSGTVHQTYPVIAYGHSRDTGVIAIANGFLYSMCLCQNTPIAWVRQFDAFFDVVLGWRPEVMDRLACPV